MFMRCATDFFVFWLKNRKRLRKVDDMICSLMLACLQVEFVIISDQTQRLTYSLVPFSSQHETKNLFQHAYHICLVGNLCWWFTFFWGIF